MTHAIAAEPGDSSFTASDPPSTERRVMRAVVTGVALVSLVQVMLLFHGVNRDARAIIFSVLAYGGSATASLLAILLVWRRSAASGAFALAVFFAFFANASSHVAIYWWVVDAKVGPTTLALVDSLLPVGVVCMSAALVRFLALFPTPLVPSDFGADARLRGIRVASLEPSLLWGSAAGLALVAVIMTVVNATTLRFFKPLLIGCVFASFVLALSNIRIAYRVADADGRRQMFWVVEGLVALVGILAIAVVLKVVEVMSGGESAHNWFALAILAAFGALLVCLMIAMFFSGALDPELAIRRTAVYGVLGIVLVFVFSGVEGAVQDYLRRWLPMSDSMSGIITGGTVALSIEPLKDRINKLAERVVARTGIAPAREHTHHH